MKFSEYFTEENEFLFIENVREGKEPWSVLSSIPDIVEERIRCKASAIPRDFENYMWINAATKPGGAIQEKSIMITRTAYTNSPFCDDELGVYIGAGTFLEAGAVIKGPCFIGEACQIRHGAYIRGSVIVGDESVIGHATEIKNSIVMDFSNAGHFNYLGDSILGSYSNMGAGSVFANLKFRSRDEIRTGKIKEILTTSHTGEPLQSGRDKLGAVIGDYTEIGCNTVVLPGAMVGSDCWIYPNTTLPRRIYPSGSVIRNKGALDVECEKRPGL